MNRSPTKYLDLPSQSILQNASTNDRSEVSMQGPKLISPRGSCNHSVNNSQFPSFEPLQSRLINQRIWKEQTNDEGFSTTRRREKQNLLSSNQENSQYINPSRLLKVPKKRPFVQQRTDEDDKQVELQDHYQLVLTSAHMMFSFMNNIQFCWESTMRNQMDLKLYRYIINLQALFTLIELEKYRRQQQIPTYNGNYNKAIKQCHSFIRQLFYNLIELRGHLDESILELNQESEIKQLATRIITNHKETYSAFKSMEIDHPFRKLTQKIYMHISQTFQQTRQQHYARLGLLSLFCVEHKRLFDSKNVPIFFKEYFEHGHRVRRESVQGYDLQYYLKIAPIEIIIKHHKDLKQQLKGSIPKILHS